MTPRQKYQLKLYHDLIEISNRQQKLGEALNNGDLRYLLNAEYIEDGKKLLKIYEEIQKYKFDEDFLYQSPSGILFKKNLMIEIKQKLLSRMRGAVISMSLINTDPQAENPPVITTPHGMIMPDPANMSAGGWVGQIAEIIRREATPDNPISKLPEEFKQFCLRYFDFLYQEDPKNENDKMDDDPPLPNPNKDPQLAFSIKLYQFFNKVDQVTVDDLQTLLNDMNEIKEDFKRFVEYLKTNPIGNLKYGETDKTQVTLKDGFAVCFDTFECVTAEINAMIVEMKKIEKLERVPDTDIPSVPTTPYIYDVTRMMGRSVLDDAFCTPLSLFFKDNRDGPLIKELLANPETTENDIKQLIVVREAVKQEWLSNTFDVYAFNLGAMGKSKAYFDTMNRTTGLINYPIIEGRLPYLYAGLLVDLSGAIKENSAYMREYLDLWNDLQGKLMDEANVSRFNSYEDIIKFFDNEINPIVNELNKSLQTSPVDAWVNETAKKNAVLTMNIFIEDMKDIAKKLYGMEQAGKQYYEHHHRARSTMPTYKPEPVLPPKKTGIGSFFNKIVKVKEKLPKTKLKEDIGNMLKKGKKEIKGMFSEGKKKASHTLHEVKEKLGSLNKMRRR